MRFIFLCFFGILTYCLNAQVTIGAAYEPTQGTLLDLKETKSPEANSIKGLLLPRVSITNLYKLNPIVKDNDADYDKQKQLLTGSMIYNISKPSDTGFPQGVYTWDGNMWKNENNDEEWFRIASFVLPKTVGKHTINLYDQFKSQASSTIISSGTDSNLPSISSSSELDYYIYGYDSSFYKVNDLKPDGTLDYEVILTSNSTKYINFIIKKHL